MKTGKQHSKAHILAAVTRSQPDLRVNSFEFKATVVAVAAITIPTLHIGTLASFTGYDSRTVKNALNQMQHEILGQLSEDMQGVINELQADDSDKSEAPNVGEVSPSEIQPLTIEETNTV